MKIINLETNHPLRVRITTDKHIVSVNKQCWDRELDAIAENNPDWPHHKCEHSAAVRFARGAQ